MNAPDACKQRISVLESPWNKRDETLCICKFSRLYFSKLYEVLKALADRFNMTKHHRGRSGDMKVMGRMHNIQPFLCATFSLTDQPSHPVYQDLRAGSGKRIQPRLFERF